MNCKKGLCNNWPRPKDILDLSFWNTSEEMIRKAHDNWSVSYEQDMKTSMYQAPDFLVPGLQKAIENTLPSVEKDSFQLLDIGAGSGLIGEKLKAKGFTNLVAIDLSAKMLALAEKKNVYKAIVCDSLYNWRKYFAVGQFDAAVSCSVFTPGQLKPTAFDEIISLIKPGGIMAHSIREDAYTTSEYGYEKKLNEMEEAGKIILLKKEKVLRYAHERASEYTVPHSFILVYQIVKHQ